MSDTRVQLGNKSVRPLSYGGHGIYGRKCFSGDHDGSDNLYARTVGGVYLPEAYADKSYMAEVLAKGPKVAKCCSKEHRRLHDRPWQYVDAVGIGDILLCPNAAIGIKRSALETLGWKTEFFIEESVPVARQVEEHGNLMLEPLGDWVWIELLANTYQDVGDIIVGYTATAQPKLAQVLQIGTGIRNRHGEIMPFSVAPGDKVLVRHNIEPFTHNGNQYYFVKDPCGQLKEPDIYATVTE